MQTTLEARAKTFDLKSQLEVMISENAWHDGMRNAATLINDQKMRIVLVAMRAGAEVQGHQVDCPISVLLVEGEIKFHAGSNEFPLKQGQLLALQPGIVHGITAVSESAFLLTLATHALHPIES